MSQSEPSQDRDTCIKEWPFHGAECTQVTLATCRDEREKNLALGDTMTFVVTDGFILNDRSI